MYVVGSGTHDPNMSLTTGKIPLLPCTTKYYISSEGQQLFSLSNAGTDRRGLSRSCIEVTRAAAAAETAAKGRSRPASKASEHPQTFIPPTCLDPRSVPFIPFRLVWGVAERTSERVREKAGWIFPLHCVTHKFLDDCRAKTDVLHDNAS